jgi:hypothetical protein
VLNRKSNGLLPHSQLWEARLKRAANYDMRFTSVKYGETRVLRKSCAELRVGACGRAGRGAGAARLSSRLW